MKKVLAALVFTIILMAVTCVSGFGEEESMIGKSLLFGHYEQNYEYGYGTDPIEWIVLDQTDTSVMLMSKHPLEYMAFNKDKKDTTWAQCSLRKWLNSTFLDLAFFPEELAVIQTTEIKNNTKAVNDKDWNGQCGQNTKDKVFLLSYQEVQQYLLDDSIECTQYVKDLGAAGIFSDNETWWLRSPGKKNNEACYTGNGKPESGRVTDLRCVLPVIWINDTEFDWNDDPLTHALNAYDLYDQGKYAEAIEVFDTLGNYFGSDDMSIACRVNVGDAAVESKEYASALSWYSESKDKIIEIYQPESVDSVIKDYDIPNKILECKYQQAVDLIENSDPIQAIEVLTSIGNYKDSMKLIRDCMEQQHIQWSWLTSTVGEAVNTGKDTGYSKSNQISDDKDPHFGWGLGRFMMSGYTERNDEGSVPVFIKTPGDNMILSFVLEQDIDALNGDPTLSIADDKDGYDSQFQIGKIGFGRGTLLVQHKDAKRHDDNGNAKPYVNYLVANDGTGANTKVEIKEEGKYTVALDYEIVKQNKIVVVNKPDYYDYRICFSFEVRNGSGMFYLFDIGSGSELQDYSRTSDGFRIDLANSNVLSINYIRYALNQSGTGLDVRKDAIASDGDAFENVGYYEITVTNKQTGEKLTKHIFVGRAADLKEYQEADPELSKFE